MVQCVPLPSQQQPLQELLCTVWYYWASMLHASWNLLRGVVWNPKMRWDSFTWNTLNLMIIFKHDFAKLKKKSLLIKETDLQIYDMKWKEKLLHKLWYFWYVIGVKIDIFIFLKLVWYCLKDSINVDFMIFSVLVYFQFKQRARRTEMSSKNSDEKAQKLNEIFILL